MGDKLDVLIIRPEEYPEKMTIDNTLEAMQGVVGGLIEPVYPFDDPVALVVNDEGRILGLPLNRALTDNDGKPYEILCGNILVVGLTEDEFGEETFGSLSQELMDKYEKKFHQPEMFIKIGREIHVRTIPDERADINNCDSDRKQTLPDYGSER